MNAMTAKSQQQSQNPFPGLRPFRSDEHHLFFGREDQTAALLQLLRANRFLAVVGTSGSGKSSLVRAGMIAALHGGTMTHAGSTWEIIILRPGGSPIENLARAFVEADLYDAEDPNTLPRLLATLSRSRFGLVEAVKQSDIFEPETNLLVVVDQFEELFRFRQQGIGSEEAAAAFVNLLLTGSEQSERPIYVTITMRSDYLGDCSEIPGLAEAVNDGEYLIPRLLRDQKRDAIEKPIGVGGARIDPLLVQRLLNEVGDDSDQLPVLQHALMRMWDVWSADGKLDRPIELRDFEATGGLASALSNHADEVYDSLPDDAHRLACEKIFKTLTEKGADNRGIRRPTRLETLETVASADRATVLRVLDAFRQPGVTFLMPGTDVELSDRTVIDLSHESLMRIWQRLCVWVEDEAQSARIFRRLRDTARLWGEGKAGLFRDPDLQIALTWRDTESPNAEWAEQYGGDFGTAVDFLEQSAAEVEADKREREAAQQRELEQTRRLAEAERQRAEDQSRAATRLRWLVRGLGLVAMLALTAMVIAWAARQNAREKEELAADRAEEARRQTNKAVAAQQQTAEALSEVEEKEAEAQEAAETARRAEQRSREFRYATDMQLASRLLQDDSTAVPQLLDRLDEHDPAQNPELDEDRDPRGFEWHYLRSLLDEGASVFSGFDETVVAATLSPQGELVMLDADGLLKRFDPETRVETGPVLDIANGSRLDQLALSPDGTLVAMAVGEMAVGEMVQLVDATTGEEITASLPANASGGMVFTADSRTLVTVGSAVGWWDVGTGQPIALRELEVRSYRDPIALAADGLTLAVVHSGESSSGRMISNGNFSVFRLDPATRDIVVVLNDRPANMGTIRTIALSPDGKSLLASQYFSGDLNMFDTETGTRTVSNGSEHAASVSAIAFHPTSSQLVTASRDGMIKVWKDSEQLDSPETTSLKGHAGAIESLSFSLDGRQLISSSDDTTTRIWDLASPDGLADRLVTVNGRLRGRFSPDGLLVTAAPRSNRLQLFDPVTGRPLATLPVENGPGVNSLAFSPLPDNRLLALGFGGRANESHVELWDIDRAERLAVMPGSTGLANFETDENSGVVSGLAFSPDGRHLVACFGSLNTLGGGDRGRFPLVVYDVASRRAIRFLEGHRNYCASVTFSRDGAHLASASHDGTARIWDAQTWQPLHVLENPDPETDQGDRRVQSVAFSPDGRLLAMASAEGSVIIWDVADGQQLQTLRGHANAVWGVAFSPNGRTLASAGDDLTIRLWNVATWRDVMRIDVPDGSGISGIKELAFSPGGDRLLAAGNSGSLVFSAQPADGRAEQLASQLEAVLQSQADFRNRVRMISEDPDLDQALEIVVQRGGDSGPVQAALAAARANRHAARGAWEDACEALDRLAELNGEQPEDWLRAAGLLRVSRALMQCQRLVEAARLLRESATRRTAEGFSRVTKAVGFGISGTLQDGEFRLTASPAGSPADRANLREGDVLLQVNDVEMNKETSSRIRELLEGDVGAVVRLTLRRAASRETDEIELVKDEYLVDPATREQLLPLLAELNQRLEQDPSDAELLELRGELAGHWNGLEEQVADYTAALEAHAKAPEDDAAMRRLSAHRAHAYFAMQQWQSATDDYARAGSDGDRGGNFLSKQAEALARLSSDENWDSNWKVLVPTEMHSTGEATFGKESDQSVFVSGTNADFDTYTIVGPFVGQNCVALRLETIPDGRLPGSGAGRWNDGEFLLSEIEAVLETADGDEHRLQFADAFADYSRRSGLPQPVANAIDSDLSTDWGVLGRLSETHVAVFRVQSFPDIADGNHQLKVRLRFEDGQWPQRNLGRFRLSYAVDPQVVERERDRLRLAKLADPVVRLAATLALQNDQPAIDVLVQQHPSSAAAIGDLFLRDEKKDWERAAQIYSFAIDAETKDADLLAKRARAYEALQQWEAAADDWTRAAELEPRGRELLAEYANRLDEAGERALAITLRQQAQESLEAVLQADPENDPATEQLARVLLDGTRERDPQWTVLRDGEVKAQDGATLNVDEDSSILLNRDESAKESDELTLEFDLAAAEAVRVEYATEGRSPSDRSPSAGGQPAWAYQALATDQAEPALESVRGRYVRIDLPGDAEQYPRNPRLDANGRKIMLLSEVQVFAGERNVARGASVNAARSGSFVRPEMAADGNTSSATIQAMSLIPGANPWWEVDLGQETDIDRVKVWSQPPAQLASFASGSMNYTRVRVLDARRQVVFEQLIADPPQPSLEFRPGARLVHLPDGDAPGQRALWQLSLDPGSQSRPWRRLRVSRSDKLPVVPGEGHRDAEASPLPAARLAGAYDLSGDADAAARWFDRAWDEADTRALRESVFQQLGHHPQALNELVRRRPNDPYLQLATARNHVTRGQEQLVGNQPDHALEELQKAREILTELREQNPQPRWNILTPNELKSAGGATLTRQDDGSVFVSGDLRAKETFSLDFAQLPGSIKAIRLEALHDGRLPSGGPGTHRSGNFVLSEFHAFALTQDGQDGMQPIPLKAELATLEDRPAKASLSSGELGWSVGFGNEGRDQTAYFRIDRDEPLSGAGAMRVVLDFYYEPGSTVPALLGRFRLSATSDSLDAPSLQLGHDVQQADSAELDIALAKAFAQLKRPDDAAVAFDRALEQANEEEERRKLLDELLQHPEALNVLAGQRPDDLQLQEALARSHAEDGKQALDEQPEQALVELERARQIVARALSGSKQPQWTILDPDTATSQGGAVLTPQKDGSILASGKNPDRDVCTFIAHPALQHITAIRLEALPDPSLPHGGPGRSPASGNFHLSEIRVYSGGTPVPLTEISVGFHQTAYDPANAIDGKVEGQFGWSVYPRSNEAHTAYLATDIDRLSDEELKIEFYTSTADRPQNNMGRFRLSVAGDADAFEASRSVQALMDSGVTNLEPWIARANANLGRMPEAVDAFSRALDQTIDPANRAEILQNAVVYEGLLDRLTELHSDDAGFHALLAEHFGRQGDYKRTREAAERARMLYEQQLEAEPLSSRVAAELADVLLVLERTEWKVLVPSQTEMRSEGGARLAVLDDNSILASGRHADQDVYTIPATTDLTSVRAIRLEALTHDSLPNKGPGRAVGRNSGLFVLDRFEVSAAPQGVSDSLKALHFSGMTADHYLKSQPVDPQTGKWHIAGGQGSPRVAFCEVEDGVAADAGLQLEFRMIFNHADFSKLSLGRFRLSVSEDPRIYDLEEDLLQIKSPWLRLGALYHSLGETKKARDAFASAIDSAHDDPSKVAQATLAARYEKPFADLLALDPDNPVLLRGLTRHRGLELVDEGKFAAAVDVLSEALKSFPEDTELLRQRAGAYEKLANWQAAVDDYSQVIVLETDDARRRTAQRDRAVCRIRLGEFPEAADLLFTNMLLDSQNAGGIQDAFAAQFLADRQETAKVAAARLGQRLQVMGGNNRQSDWLQWLTYAYTAQEGLVTQDDRSGLLEMVGGDGEDARLATAAIQYRLGHLDDAAPLLDAAEDKPYFRTLAAMLLFDQGETQRAREVLEGVGKWIQQQREQDPDSAVPAQQDWRTWAIQLAVYQEASRKLNGSEDAEQNLR